LSQIEFRRLEKKEFEMKYLFLAFLLIQFLACSKKPEVLAQKASSPSPTVFPAPIPNNKEKTIDDFITKDEKQAYEGYDIFKETDVIEGGGTKIEVSKVLLKKGKKIVGIFPGMLHPFNTNDFGLFSFLGNGRKQLIVSASEPRGGLQWIAELAPNYKLIFNTGEWGIGREGADLRFIDIDQDGVYEITAGDFWYYIFNDISMSETPVVNIVFGYDKRAGKYVPANHKFKEYSLQSIDERIKSLPANEGYRFLGTRVDVLLQYLYAGKEKEGWEFFDRAYQAKDKAVAKRIIKTRLSYSSVYKYIRIHSQR
jgi:hypothetical protein